MKTASCVFASPAFLLLFMIFSACGNPKVDTTAETEARNESTVRAILSAMDNGDPATLERNCAADFRIHHPFLPEPGSLETFKGMMLGQKTAFPDMRHEVQTLFAKGNMVCVRGIFSGTNTGPIQENPPAGNRVVLPFLFTDEFDAEGKVKARHVQFDTKTFNTQLMAGQ